MSTTTQKIIDFRSRPAFLAEFYGATPGTAGYDTARWLNRRTGSLDDAHFHASFTLDGYLEEIRQSGIIRAVVVGRDTPGLVVGNQRIAELCAGHPELVGLGSVDPQARGVTAALASVEHAIKGLGQKGINLEPGFGAPALHADDLLFLPIYDACQELGVPVCLMSGPTTPDLAYNDPAAVGRVARAFPRLSIICYHGFWPRVNEIIGVAFRYENVHLCPDMYLFAPGSAAYVEAANGVLREQFLFGTSYPFRAMRQTVDDFLRLGWKDEVLDKLLYGNAKRLLQL
ncbi:amidohydrolase family protein [Dechloromonas sp. A34]|uniref:amidohydrolase family protein n=1 Tax=Dechloromonas sp. A34 TaxID=447588 RepID=UPI002248E7FC|nr:amidohydrolase family protein [Dechloromonas sp. A34]